MGVKFIVPLNNIRNIKEYSLTKSNASPLNIKAQAFYY